MLFFHPVDANIELRRDNPLFVGNFFELKGMWWRNRKKRQQMIFSVALAYLKLVKKQLKTPGMITEELFLTSLMKEVRDARVIVERFFTITRLGFNLGDGVNHSPTQVSPKRLPASVIEAIEQIQNRVVFSPGCPPTQKHLVQSTVSVRLASAPFVRIKLRETGREDLIPVVDWLYKQSDPITFYYRPSGKLQARDTSVWPIRAIELWPGWLRTELFGTVVDIENAFCQFILSHIEKKHSGNKNLMQLKYPDLLRAAYDKHRFRVELVHMLKLEVNDYGISVVKKLIMALANGSNASPQMMVNSCRSEAVAIVKQSSPSLLPSELLLIGARLQSISKQFRSAKRELCINVLKSKPSRENQRKIFQMYFDWERRARYKMWEMSGFTGLALHDGLDGVQISNPATFAKDVFDKHGLRIVVEEVMH